MNPAPSLRDQTQFNIGAVPVSKHFVQNFYKQQLDRMMEEKNQQKLSMKMQRERQKQEFNDRLKKLNELQQLKDLSYKNYYQMLAHSQEKHNEHFVPNNKQRDELKDGLIEKTAQIDKSRKIEEEMKIREREMKETYKQHLSRQIQEKKHAKSVNKLQLKQQIDMMRSISRVGEWEQQKKLADQMQYKQVLDKATEEKQRSRSMRHYMNKSNEFNLDEYDRHNPLKNPLPYNIQNPYILRQMNSSYAYGKNQSYLASIANGNL